MSSDLIASVAAAVADSARSAILLALADGRSRTAKELAFLARVSPSTTSAHLAKLVDLNLLAVMPLGRNRYFRLASPLVGRMIEAMGNVAAEVQPRIPRPRGDAAMRLARTCYDHLAGFLGVAIADSLQNQGLVVLSDDGGEVTQQGVTRFDRLGIAIPVGRSQRIFCRPCLDWTERRPHLAGAVGAALCSHCLERGWVERIRDSRALRVTASGEAAFADIFGVQLPGAARTEAA
jgi:DNA-binding transcriptional ArsR family regulator